MSPSQAELRSALSVDDGVPCAAASMRSGQDK
jgi:hypothetical protein